MKIKIALLSVVAILIIGLAAAAFWWLRKPQVITFSDDAKLTLLAVDYGKRHAPPGVKAPAGATNRPAARRGNSFTTTNDTLVLWVQEQYDPKQYHYFQYYIGDKANTACVQSYGRNSNGGRQGNEVVAVQLDAFPRRQGKFVVRVQEQGNGSQEMSDQKFVISNPAHGPLAKWAAEPLPSTKQDDDLSVTLTKLVAGANMPYTRNSDDPDDPVNKGVQAVFHVERNGTTVNNWQPVSVETSDATGNHVSGWISGNQWQNDEDTVTYQYGLWPDEPAWKARFEFSQQSDFADNEVWTVQNLPIQPGRRQDFYNYGGRRQTQTNSAVAEADVNGFHLKVFPAKQFTDAGPNDYQQGGLAIQINPALSDGVRMTLAKVTDDQTNDIEHSDNGWSRNNNVSTYSYSLRDISGLTNLNLTIALHKSRFVEFTAKPEKETEAAAAQ